MGSPPARAEFDELIVRHAATIAQVYSRSGAEARRVTHAAFNEALFRGICALPDSSSAAIESYLASVHAPDLALSCALAAGDVSAWEEFVTSYRPILYAAARAITRDESGRELADSLWADLYGIRAGTGERRSLLTYFHGRSSLAGWLRAVIARRHIDSVRAQRFDQPLDSVEADKLAVAPDHSQSDRERSLSKVSAALRDGLAALKPRDRMRLAYYYADGLTLKEIGQLLNEREWTVSRRLKSAREAVRKRVERSLRSDGLSPAQISQCYNDAIEGWSFDLAILTPPASVGMQQKPGGSFQS
jgi:RNA polymerase sigma-70 factor (ECF subfamily)